MSCIESAHTDAVLTVVVCFIRTDLYLMRLLWTCHVHNQAVIVEIVFRGKNRQIVYKVLHFPFSRPPFIMHFRHHATAKLHGTRRLAWDMMNAWDRKGKVGQGG